MGLHLPNRITAVADRFEVYRAIRLVDRVAAETEPIGDVRTCRTCTDRMVRDLPLVAHTGLAARPLADPVLCCSIGVVTRSKRPLSMASAAFLAAFTTEMLALE